MRTGRRTSQRGVALVTALMVVSVATVAAVALATRLQIDINRTSNLLDADQATLYALGAEGWALHVLAQDRSEGNVDSLGEQWATLLPPFAVEGGTVSAWVEDLQGRFNLNSLVADGSVNKPAVERMRWLLESLELDTGLADSVVDWIDADLDVYLPDGAEDDEYLNYERPYRPGNGLMWSPSELRLVKGMSREGFEKLIPLVTTLPIATPVNVNTAPARVLMTVAEGMTESDAESIVSDRGEDGYKSVDSFLEHPALKGLKVDQQAVAVSSEWFAVHAEADIGRGRARIYSIVHRASGGQTKVVLRSRGGR
ncbi:MAG: type II secretion system minor pseudopilin GspK [Gammaproteobacteria bacterium]|nr:type II secretion system minor pseudopilin GspK [Gammaproteobacteria bacterium]